MVTTPHQPLLWRAEMFRRLQNFIKPSIHALNYLTNKKESPRHRLSQYNVFREGIDLAILYNVFCYFGENCFNENRLINDQIGEFVIKPHA